ncbi:MAG: hypothetical protein AAFV30_04720, partial [Pseudomonadota bacterium]
GFCPKDLGYDLDLKLNIRFLKHPFQVGETVQFQQQLHTLRLSDFQPILSGKRMLSLRSKSYPRSFGQNPT